MPSTTSGTTDFSLDVNELIEDALESVGGEHSTGGEQKKVRRKLNLILIELQNKGIPLSKLDTETVTLVSGQQDYELDSSVSSVVEMNLKSSDGVETYLQRYGEKEWHRIPTKDNVARPSTFSTDRNRDNVRLKVWPVPPTDDYTAELLVARRIQDVDASYQRIDLPYRFYPLLSRWLSYEVSLMREGVDVNKRQELKANYLESLTDTMEEDRERTDFFMSPIVPSGR